MAERTTLFGARAGRLLYTVACTFTIVGMNILLFPLFTSCKKNAWVDIKSVLLFLPLVLQTPSNSQSVSSSLSHHNIWYNTGGGAHVRPSRAFTSWKPLCACVFLEIYINMYSYLYVFTVVPLHTKLIRSPTKLACKQTKTTKKNPQRKLLYSPLVLAHSHLL